MRVAPSLVSVISSHESLLTNDYSSLCGAPDSSSTL